MGVCRKLLVFMALVGSLGAQSQTGVTAQLDAKETQLADLYADYWRNEYQIARGSESLSSRPIQERIRKVISDEQFLRRLKAAQFRDPLLKRRRNLFLEEAAYTKISNDEKLTAIVEDITRYENTMRYQVGDGDLTRAELTQLVTRNPDRQLRRQAWEARAQMSGNGERIRQAMKLRNQLALAYTDELFSTFMLRKKGMEAEKLFEWFEDIRDATEPEYQALLQQLRHDLHVDTVEPWDLEFYFSRSTKDFEQMQFVTEEGWPKAKQLLGSLGYNLDTLPVHMEVADLSFAGAAYPILYGKEVKILANRYSGIFFFDRLFHATGHALHYAMMNESSFLLSNNYAEPFDEGLAQVIVLQLYRPEIGVKLFTLTREETRVVADTYRLKAIFDLRSTMADSLFEFEAYADPEQDLTTLYNAIHSKYLGVDMHGVAVWAYNPMYGSDPIYLQSYIVGDMVAHQIAYSVDQRFGSCWGEQAGTYLQEHFYSRGAETTLDGIMRQGTGEPLSVRYLTEFLRGSRNTRPPWCRSPKS